MPRAAAACLGVADLGEIWGKPTVRELRPATCVEKPSWVGHGLGDSPEQMIGVSQVMESSGLAPARGCHLGWGRVQQRKNGTCQHLPPQRTVLAPTPSSLTLKLSQFSSSLYVPGTFQAAASGGLGLPRLSLHLTGQKPLWF